MRQLMFDVPYRYDDFLKDTDYLLREYPSMLEVHKIGKSEDGRDLLVFRIGKGEIPVIITVGVHGREAINPMVVIRAIESYLELVKFNEPLVVDFTMPERLEPVNPFTRGFLTEIYNQVQNYPYETVNRIPDWIGNVEERFSPRPKGAEIPTEYHPKQYLKEFSFYIVPLLNPDGYEIALGGFDTIQTPEYRANAITSRIPAEEWKANARGVDLNRNFPSVTWRPKFLGDQPGSEKETQALMYLFSVIPAHGYLDLHSRGKAIYYAKSQMSPEYNERQERIATRLQAVTGYDLMPPEEEIKAMDSGGNTVHYFSETYQKPAITIETVSDLEPFPLDLRHQRPTFEEIALVPFEFTSALIEE